MRTTDQKIVAYIPVRGGSKSIPLKNIKPIAGKPLVQWTIEAALEARCIDMVYVATDSKRIAETVGRMGLPSVKVIGRGADTATDEASTESALLEFCSTFSPSHVFLIQATSPLLRASDLEEAWDKFNRGGFDSMVSGVRQKRFLWDLRDNEAVAINYRPDCRPRRQDFDGYLVENGAFYLSSRARILDSGCRISGRIGLFEMPEETYFEIDEPSDWMIVDGLLRNRKSQQRQKRRKSIRMLVMDCDGVLTDGGMYYSQEGEEYKKFHTRDGKGLELLRGAGFKTAIITGEKTPFVQRRAEKLCIDHVFLGIQDKATALRELSEIAEIPLDEMAYIGDDVNDLPALRLCGLSACPGDAVPAVKQEVDIVLDAGGGNGAVRQLADHLLEP